MSDVIWAAGIAGAVSVVGNLATYLITTQTARRDVKAQEAARLEHERVARRDNYQRLVYMLYRLNKYGVLGAPPTSEDWKGWLDDFVFIRAGAAIVATDPVRATIDQLGDYLDTIGHSLLVAAAEGPERWRAEYQQHRHDVDEKRDAVTAAIRHELEELNRSAATGEARPLREDEQRQERSRM